MAFTTSVPVFQNSSGVSTDVSATTTSPAFETGDRNELSVQVICDTFTSGSGVFTFLVSNDGINYKAYNRMVTNVNGGTVASSVTLSAAGSDLVFVPTGDHFAYIKVVVTVTGTGTYNAFIHAY